MRKVTDLDLRDEELELASALVVVRVVEEHEVVDEAVVAVVRFSGKCGVKINHRIKLKSIGVIVRVRSEEPFFKEASSWFRGVNTVEETAV